MTRSQDSGKSTISAPPESQFPAELRKEEYDQIRKRREALPEGTYPLRADDQDPPDGQIGLALSGGGIRSATFCLGVLQAMAQNKWIRKIDYLSTVSGGGYIGSFLGRLFTRNWVRGLFVEDDFTEPSGLVDKLQARGQQDPLSAFLWDKFNNDERAILQDRKAAKPEKKRALVAGFNRILQGELIYSEDRFPRPKDQSPVASALSDETIKRCRENPPKSSLALAQLNRRLLEEAYPNEIRRANKCKLGVERVEEELKNPDSECMKYLRNNGRYLSPNNAGDTWMMVAVFLRNWLAMLAVLLMLAWGACMLVVLTRAGLWHWGLWFNVEDWFAQKTDSHLWWSATLVWPAVVLAAAIPLGWAYWLTQRTWLQFKPRWLRKVSEPMALVTTILLFLAASAGMVWGLTKGPKVWAWATIPIAGQAGLSLACYGVLYRWAGQLDASRDRVYWIRNRLTDGFAAALVVATVLLVLALVDSLGQSLYALLKDTERLSDALKALGGITGISALVLGASRLKFLFDLLPKRRAVQLPLELVASLGALVLVVTLLTLASVGAHAVAWHGRSPEPAPMGTNTPNCTAVHPGANIYSWLYPAKTNQVILAGDNYIQVVSANALPQRRESSSHPDWIWLVCALVLVAVLSCLYGHTLAFINLSSLHTFYKARLVRAYLGASNERRWTDLGRRISTPIAGDDREWRDYQPWLAGGPLHLVNVTVNETVSGKTQVEYRDRKGLILAVGPAGLSVGRKDHAKWGTKQEPKPDPRSVKIQPLNVKRGEFHALGFAKEEKEGSHECEAASLGRWVGISGAAFTTGLGYRTSLAKSLLLGLFNVRLGYWWNSGISPRKRGGCTPPRFWNWVEGWLSYVFPVQIHLLHELTGRFRGPSMKRWYLSDGGHFENTAAYELLRRRLPFIIVCDCGCDPDYNFEDVANLVRKARIDFDAEIEFLDEIKLKTLGLPPEIGKWISKPEHFRPKPKPDEEKHAPRRTRHHALLARVNYADGAPPSYILFLKPSLNGDEPLDVLQYQKEHPAFPNESTADQYFDEAQWESYRKLGHHIGEDISIFLQDQ